MSTPIMPFQAGSPMMIVGPTNCGKTCFVHRLLTHDMFTQSISSILYCYGVYQPYYDQMKETLEPPPTFQHGLPTKSEIDAMYDGQFHVIVLDDLMEDIVRSKDIQQLFTKYCHHLNITAIFISQNIFHQGPYARSISLNSHVIVIFANKRDESQIRTFARQIYPVRWKRFILAYEEIMQEDFAYIVIDCTPSHPRDLKIRTHIFPGEETTTYVI